MKQTNNIKAQTQNFRKKKNPFLSEDGFVYGLVLGPE